MQACESCMNFILYIFVHVIKINANRIPTRGPVVMYRYTICHGAIIGGQIVLLFHKKCSSACYHCI